MSDRNWFGQLSLSSAAIESRTRRNCERSCSTVARSGKIPYKCPIKVLESNLVAKLGKVKEVHLTLACRGKALKAKVDWQSKEVILVEDA